MARISVIIPVYNVGRYINETLDSLVEQSVGFENSIELILIDDGSTDDSGNKCQEFAQKYPNNVTYIHQDNAGVSCARNLGLEYASGEYVHFLDGDDMLSKNFYKKMTLFLENNTSVDFVASKIKFFDAIIDSHPLNDKFRSTRVIDTSVEPDSPLLHAVSCVFRRSALDGHKFDTKLHIAEDVKFISEILRQTGKFGVHEAPVYHYRKRIDDSSAIGSKEKNKHYYLEVPEYSYSPILDNWMQGDKSSLWAEHTILYDISYRLRQKKQTILNSREEEKYKNTILSLASRCSDEAIVSSRFLSLHQKMYILSRKHGKDLHHQLTTVNTLVKLNGISLFNLDSAEIHLDFLTPLGDRKYRAEGYVSGASKYLPTEYSLFCDGTEYPLKFVYRAQREESFLGDVYYDGAAFEVDFVFPAESKVYFTASVVNSLPRRMIMHTGPFTRFGALKLTYRRDADRLIKRTKDELISHPYSIAIHMRLELRMLVQILLNWRLNTAKLQLKKLRQRNLSHLRVKAKVFELLKPILFIAEAVLMIPRALLLRSIYYIVGRYKEKPIWIISDRGMAAGDNGEAFFRYLMSLEDLPADAYFAISRKSKDYDRVSAIGPTLNHGSLKHKLMHLLADKVISSQADIETTNPFMRQLDHFVDLFTFKFVFLQHGVIRHDLSDWLNRFNKNISLFVVTAEKEHKSILENPYYYKEEQVVLCGLPRYDLLKSSPKRKIILAPTYRKNLARMKTDRNGARKYDPLFRATNYRNFYNDLINDSRLLDAMRRHGVSGEFYLHPAFSAQRNDFDGNTEFQVMEFPNNYNKAFEEGSLMISDHSSVIFDFAYLRKPVLYAHFDVDTFFQGHSYKESNFFSDVDDGFGEVCYDYDSLVSATIRLIECDFAMSDKYRGRIEDFFKFNDTSNSKRLYNVMMGKR